MPKSAFFVLLVVVVLGTAGCCTVHGAASGLQQDVHNMSNPDANGWHALQHADEWMRNHLW